MLSVPAQLSASDSNPTVRCNNYLCGRDLKWVKDFLAQTFSLLCIILNASTTIACMVITGEKVCFKNIFYKQLTGAGMCCAAVLRTKKY